MRERGEPVPESELMQRSPLFPDEREVCDIEPGTRVVGFVMVDHRHSQLREGTALEPTGKLLRVEFDARLPNVIRNAPRDADMTNPKLRRFLVDDIRLLRRVDYNLLRRDPDQIRQWVKRGVAMGEFERTYLARKLRGPGIEPERVPAYDHEPVVERKTFIRGTHRE